MGFVGVFAGAANTPLACLLMGLELFGVQAGVYLALACVVAYLFSGHTGIYGAQVVGQAKHPLFGRLAGRRLGELGPQPSSTKQMLTSDQPPGRTRAS
jgi:hypothetical protein